MKFRGQKIEGPNVELIIIPRGGEKDDIVLKAQAILDYTPFNLACPYPKAPSGINKQGQRVYNENDPQFLRAKNEHGERRLAWMILKSLEATPDLEWENAKLSDPNTWMEYKGELVSAGFSEIEIGRIITGVMTANCLDEVKMEEARKRFYAREAEEAKRSASPKDAQDSTPPGGQQKDSD